MWDVVSFYMIFDACGGIPNAESWFNPLKDDAKQTQVQLEIYIMC